MLRIQLHDTITTIDPSQWDAVGSDPLSRHGIQVALETAGMSGMTMRYAVVTSAKGQTVACFPFACLSIDAVRLTHGLFKSVITTVRRISPDFMRTSLLICGTPWSVGNPPLRLRDGSDPRPVVREAAGLLRELAQEYGAPWTVFKELNNSWLATGQGDIGEVVTAEGYLVVPSESGWELPLPWRSYDDYRQNLRSHYRYKIRKSAAKLAKRGISVKVRPLEQAYSPEIHHLYEHVNDRAAVSLERLTAKFFSLLGRSFPHQTRLMQFLKHGNCVGWVALLRDGPTIYDLFHGIDYNENRPADLYFNQITATIRFALESHAQKLSLGQSTGTAKSRFGGVSVPLWAAIRHRSPVVQAALRRGPKKLFPPQPTVSRNVFHTLPASILEVAS
jgi:hypothetical protein